MALGCQLQLGSFEVRSSGATNNRVRRVSQGRQTVRQANRQTGRQTERQTGLQFGWVRRHHPQRTRPKERKKEARRKKHANRSETSKAKGTETKTKQNRKATTPHPTISPAKSRCVGNRSNLVPRPVNSIKPRSPWGRCLGTENKSSQSVTSYMAIIFYIYCTFKFKSMWKYLAATGWEVRNIRKSMCLNGVCLCTVATGAQQNWLPQGRLVEHVSLPSVQVWSVH